jgi:hypothetical protein
VVTHGRDGWELADYDWDPETGVGSLTYERLRKDTGELESKVVVKAQPAAPNHAGWYTGAR